MNTGRNGMFSIVFKYGQMICVIFDKVDVQ